MTSWLLDSIGWIPGVGYLLLFLILGTPVVVPATLAVAFASLCSRDGANLRLVLMPVGLFVLLAIAMLGLGVFVNGSLPLYQAEPYKLAIDYIFLGTIPVVTLILIRMQLNYVRILFGCAALLFSLSSWIFSLVLVTGFSHISWP